MCKKSLESKSSNIVYIKTITTCQSKLSSQTCGYKILSSTTAYTKDSTGGLTRGQVGPRRESGPSPAPRPQKKTGDEGREGENERSR